MLIGDLIGIGTAREVFTCPLDHSIVVKVECTGGSFQNIAEWEAWTWIRATKREKWLAPCTVISSCGTVLLQKRADQLRKDEKPKTIPEFLTDVKRENFGWLDGRLVCFDYGTILSGIRKLSGAPVPAKWDR